MDRAGSVSVSNWGALRKGQAVRFYTGDGWKKGSVSSTYQNSVAVAWSRGANPATTRVYDLRNIRTTD